jgi:phosphatidylglycerol---prolipoprotein diacylglyceryl transferase
MSGPIILPEISPFVFGLSYNGFGLRWYALAYVVGILSAWWLIARMARESGAPMARRHLDDFVLWATLGVVLGGRIGYILFYNSHVYLQDPLQMLKIWQGGMSFHGGLLGVILAVFLYCRSAKIDWVRFHDYLAVTVPIGLGLGRVANFINGELWGKLADVPWAMVFWTDPAGLPRHPSQLYEAVLEGPVLLTILLWLFWRTDARRRPGLLCGAFLLGYGVFRFIVEFFREPDRQLAALAEATGLHMGQWLCLPMILLGAVLILRARRRPLAG